MSNNISFNQVIDQHLKTLEQYVPVVSRVHGASHPVFYEVHKMFDTIHEKINEAGLSKPELNDEFMKLREITNAYTIPDDVCETYEAVYNMLAEMDQAYQD